MINLDFYKTGDGTKQFWGDAECVTPVQEIVGLILALSAGSLLVG